MCWQNLPQQNAVLGKQIKSTLYLEFLMKNEQI